MTKELTSEQWALKEAMSELSEEHWCAGWLIHCEHSLWNMVYGGSRRWGMGEVSEGDITDLKRRSESVGGWIRWDHATSSKRFVPMAEWLEIHAKWQAELDAWAKENS